MGIMNLIGVTPVMVKADSTGGSVHSEHPGTTLMWEAISITNHLSQTWRANSRLEVFGSNVQ